mmetsp:Transcript_4047/g.11460  ORF Transcript_4047/g.11460 Transcript_4047/m.11460 type:complete len:410 (-) Transcript_4047:1561-2790(-)
MILRGDCRGKGRTLFSLLLLWRLLDSSSGSCTVMIVGLILALFLGLLDFELVGDALFFEDLAEVIDALALRRLSPIALVDVPDEESATFQLGLHGSVYRWRPWGIDVGHQCGFDCPTQCSIAGMGLAVEADVVLGWTAIGALLISVALRAMVGMHGHCQVPIVASGSSGLLPLILFCRVPISVVAVAITVALLRFRLAFLVQLLLLIEVISDGFNAFHLRRLSPRRILLPDQEPSFAQLATDRLVDWRRVREILELLQAFLNHFDKVLRSGMVRIGKANILIAWVDAAVRIVRKFDFVSIRCCRWHGQRLVAIRLSQVGRFVERALRDDDLLELAELLTDELVVVGEVRAERQQRFDHVRTEWHGGILHGGNAMLAGESFRYVSGQEYSHTCLRKVHRDVTDDRSVIVR